jgi:hypothetical protein
MLADSILTFVAASASAYVLVTAVPELMCRIHIALLLMIDVTVCILSSTATLHCGIITHVFVSYTGTSLPAVV